MSWGVVYYRTGDGRVPAEEFLETLPSKVAARFDVVLDTVRDAPPPQSAAVVSGRRCTAP